MSSPRFLIDPSSVAGDRACLTGTEAHHARRVLRLAAGDTITLLDGCGTRHLARIERITPERVETVILKSQQDPSPRAQVHLCQGVLKGQKMDLVCQKATELGATAIWPFISDHCARHGEQEDRPDRWRRIALEACKQCDRALPPEIHNIIPLSTLLSRLPDNTLKLMLWEEETEQPFGAIFKGNSRPDAATLLIGPEGGFATTEVTMARDAGFITTSVGRLILRAETAALAALSIAQYELGNLAPFKGDTR